MNNNFPLFSIIIPSFNRAHFLKAAINSVFNQVHTNYELIVVDDGSSDGTPSLLRHYSNRLHYISGQHEGAEKARNRGIRAATGTYLIFLDSDDILLPHALSLYESVVTRTSAQLLIARGATFSNADAITTPSDSTKVPVTTMCKDYISKKRGVWLSTSFIVINRQALVDCNAFFKKGTFPVDDLDFLLRAGTIPRCCLIDAPVSVGYRRHTTNSVNDIQRNIAALHQILDFEQQGAYPGGRERVLSRLALIGGHIQSWGRLGIRTGYYKEAITLLFRGIPSLAALLLKKAGQMPGHLSKQ